MPLLVKHLSPLGIEITGCASEGDARRFKKQKEQMSETPTKGFSSFNIEHPSVLLKATINDETGAVTNCPSQDCIHGVTKMYNAADNAARCLMMGSFEVTHNHSKLAFLRFGPGAT